MVATFSATAQAWDTVQWQRGASGCSYCWSSPARPPSSYSLTATPANELAMLRAVFTNTDGAVVTQAVSLRFTGVVPRVSRQPADMSVDGEDVPGHAFCSSGFTVGCPIGRVVMFSAGRDGLSADAVQWQRSNDGELTWVDIPGATDLGTDGVRTHTWPLSTSSLTTAAGTVLPPPTPPETRPRPQPPSPCASRR